MKRNLFKVIVLFIIVIATALILIHKNTAQPLTETLDMNSFLKKTSDSYVKVSDPLVFELLENEYATGIKDEEVTNLKFRITPDIAGSLIWQSVNTFHFIPAENFKPDTEYEVILYPADVSLDDPFLEPFSYSFTALGRQVNDLDYKFVIDENNKSKFWIEGRVIFNMATPLAVVKESITLSSPDKNLPLRWIDSEENIFIFKTEIIQNYDFPEKKLELKLYAQQLDMARDITREIDLNNYDVFQCRSVKASFENYPLVELTFSENIRQDQQLSSLISISPSVDFDITIRDNYILLKGDFNAGNSYQLQGSKEIKSITGKTLLKEINSSISFVDKKPRLLFADDAPFITGNDKSKVYFRTMNLSKVDYSITKIYENNLGQFIQDNEFAPSYWGFNNLNNVGNVVASGTFELGDTRNIWQNHEMKIGSLLNSGDTGIFVVSLKADIDYSLFRSNPDIANDFDWDEDPTRPYYFYRNTNIEQFFFLTDIALTTKITGKGSQVFVTSLETAKPIKNAVVRAYTFQNQVLASATTDEKGSCFLPHTEEPFYFIAEFEDQKCLLRVKSQKWQTSRFDVAGTTAKSLNAYFYNERGVYRPGDQINTMIIMRNSDGSFPENHPLRISLYDPRHTKVYESVLKISTDGFYHFPYTTSPDDPTGYYSLRVEVGENLFTHDLKVETVAPERIKLDFSYDKQVISPDFDQFDVTLQANYLFGKPAAGLEAEIIKTTSSVDKIFPQSKWNSFSFTDETYKDLHFQRDTENITLNNKGEAVLAWNREQNAYIPSAGRVEFAVSVIDNGGRASKKSLSIPWDPWQAYVGINTLTNYISSEKETEAEIILLDTNGEALSGEELQIKVYENDNYWWWEYDNRSHFLTHYKKMSSTRLLKEESITSQNTPLIYKLPASNSSNLLIEVSHLNSGKILHTSSRYLQKRNWSNARSRSSASIMELSADKAEYFSGDTAHISFPSSSQTRNLITIEKADQILDWWWIDNPQQKENIEFSYELTADMIPGVYVTVSVIQPHNKTAGDTPLRMYGIVPLRITDPGKKIKLELDIPQNIIPQEKFICRLKADPGSNTQFTIAVVDEGLLSLTDFDSPDPYSFFYQKQRLEVISCDIFDLVAGEKRITVDNRFAVGGGMDYAMSREERQKQFQKRQVEETDIKRFEPVSLFSGILRADHSGCAEAEFYMPDYMGAVRIMAVCVNGSKYGSASKTATVRKDLMVLPSLPRALAPGDTFYIPVEIFCFNENIKNAQVSLTAEGPLTFIGNSSETIYLNGKSDELVFFQARIDKKIEPVKITASITSGKFNHSSVINIPVRPLQPRQSVTKTVNLKPAEEATVSIPPDGLPGTEISYLQLIRPGYFDYNTHLRYLVRYPYGCLEQKVSSAFPQLYIADLVKPEIRKQILGNLDENINATVSKITKHQIDGRNALSYWEGGRHSDFWSSVYAAHFLIEAEGKGYYVPPFLISNLLSALQNRNFSDLYESGNMTKETYRLYVLAKAGKPDYSAMNYLYQSHLNKLENHQLWMLAAAFKLSNQIEIAESIIKKSGTAVPSQKFSYRYNFASPERNKAFILAMAVETGKSSLAENLYYELAEELNQDNWFSTQTRALMLWALSLYASENPQIISDETIKLSLSGDGMETQSFDIDGNNWIKNLPQSSSVKLSLSSDSAPARFKMIYDRVPDHNDNVRTNKHYSINRKIMDKNKNLISPENLKQGNAYILHFTIKQKSALKLENLALAQILPSGWEIENERIDSNNRFRNNNVDYTDIRDDRIIWFFSTDNFLSGRQVLTIPFRAVTAGNFAIPPAIMEAMYSNDYTTITEGGKTIIEK